MQEEWSRSELLRHGSRRSFLRYAGLVPLMGGALRFAFAASEIAAEKAD
jgi:hypothetical protein